LRVDDEFVNWALERALEQTSKEAAVSLLATAHAGSCALVGFYESETRLHRIALTRDSRAVLGRKVSRKGKETYEVQVLSQDQNSHNPAEDARMSALHPGEEIMDNGRVLG
jgi:pyruvate dehydrogenase phosphatase